MSKPTIDTIIEKYKSLPEPLNPWSKNFINAVIKDLEEVRAAASINPCEGSVKASERLPEKEGTYKIFVKAFNLKTISYFNGRNFEHHYTNRDFTWYDESCSCEQKDKEIERRTEIIKNLFAGLGSGNKKYNEQWEIFKNENNL